MGGLAAAGACSLLLLAGCGGEGPPAPVAARPYQDPGFVADVDFEMRYGTLLATDLTPGLATAYGIDRRPGLALLSLSVLSRRPGLPPQSMAATVSGSRSGLLGEPRALEFATLDVDGSISYLAQFEVRDGEPFVLQFEARPEAAPTRALRARITRALAVESR